MSQHITWKPHKYHARPVVVDGEWFASQREARRWSELLLLKRAGEVRLILRQVGFQIAPPVRDDQGALTCRAIKYLADFLVHWSDGRLTVEDAKGMRTPMYRAKKRRVEAIYGIEITEV